MKTSAKIRVIKIKNCLIGYAARIDPCSKYLEPIRLVCGNKAHFGHFIPTWIAKSRTQGCGLKKSRPNHLFDFIIIPTFQCGNAVREALLKQF